MLRLDGNICDGPGNMHDQLGRRQTYCKEREANTSECRHIGKYPYSSRNSVG